jgi:hypothetical protein
VASDEDGASQKKAPEDIKFREKARIMMDRIGWGRVGSKLDEEGDEDAKTSEHQCASLPMK